MDKGHTIQTQPSLTRGAIVHANVIPAGCQIPRLAKITSIYAYTIGIEGDIIEIYGSQVGQGTIRKFHVLEVYDITFESDKALNSKAIWDSSP